MDIKFPKYLSIQITSLCNSHCIFCPYDDIGIEPGVNFRGFNFKEYGNSRLPLLWNQKIVNR